MTNRPLYPTALALLLLALVALACDKPGPTEGTTTPQADAPTLRVMLVPADGGTEQGTLADYQPIFDAVARRTGYTFDIKVGQSYNAVVEAMVAAKIDIAFFGPLSYVQARERGGAELLAVAVKDNESVYYSGIFVRKDAGMKNLSDLKGKSVAFGDVNSASSFNFPIAMLLDAGLDPIDDLGDVQLTGSHANALASLEAGKVDAGCASFTSYEKAVKNRQIDPEVVVPLARSEPIPYPPLAMNPKLDPEIKKKLREAFGSIHTDKNISKDAIRGYGGKKVDRYDANFDEVAFDKAMGKLAKVTDNLKAQLLEKANR